MALDEPSTEDLTESIDGIHFVVAPELIQKYGGFKIEYAESWFGEGFYIRASIGISAF